MKKISPCEAAAILRNKGLPYGQDYALPYDIDTSNCEEFGGTRCDCNIYVRGRNIAHRDRVDPRRDLIGHLEKDCSIHQKQSQCLNSVPAPYRQPKNGASIK